MHFNFRLCFARFECILGHFSGFRVENPQNFLLAPSALANLDSFGVYVRKKTSDFIGRDFDAVRLPCVFRTF